MFKKAEKSKSKLRCAIYGISGSGKTYTSLAIAAGMSGKIALIDSERGSASKYANIFDFDCYELTIKSVEEYIETINEAEKCGYDVIILDSITPAWDAVKEFVDRVQSTMRGMSGAQAWSKGTPLQNKFINTMLGYNGHVIATMRTKTAWDFSKDETGKLKPQKIGLAPEQRSNIEYEFDLVMELNSEHVGVISKDRTGKFQDKILNKPGKDFGEELITWLNDGKDIPANSEEVATIIKFDEEMEWTKKESEGKDQITWLNDGKDIPANSEEVATIDDIIAKRLSQIDMGSVDAVIKFDEEMEWTKKESEGKDQKTITVLRGYYKNLKDLKNLKLNNEI